jgi:hypothetical protein
MARAQGYTEGPPGNYSAPVSVTSIGGTSKVAIAANPNRICVILSNNHATEVLYIAIGDTAVVNKGIRLNAVGGSVQIGGPGGLPLNTEVINVVGSSAGVLLVQEVTEA